MPVDEWTPEKVTRAVRAKVKRNMKRAMVLLQKDVQRRLSIGQPSGTSIRRSKKTGAQYVVGRPKRFGEGEPPRVLTGNLRKSITHDVKTTKRQVIGRTGSAGLPYARRLELGFFGTDSRGRNINQAERPYLRPALKENLTRIVRIIGAP